MFKPLRYSLLLVCVSTAVEAQGETIRAVRVTGFVGGSGSLSALVVDPTGVSDTRLGPGVSAGLDMQHPTFSFGSLYAGVIGSFSTLQHGANLGDVAGPGTSAATVILGTAGMVLEARDWFSGVSATLRLGGGLKAYQFSANGASSSAGLTGDVGVGFRGGSGPVEVSWEFRFLPSAFDQAKLPLRGLAAQDQQQNDFLVTLGVSFRP